MCGLEAAMNRLWLSDDVAQAGVAQGEVRLGVQRERGMELPSSPITHGHPSRAGIKNRKSREMLFSKGPTPLPRVPAFITSGITFVGGGSRHWLPAFSG